jgi:hypothetical protein
VLHVAVEVGMTDDQAHRLAVQLRVHPDSTRLASEPVRTFASAGTLSAEPNLAERSRRFCEPNQEPLRDSGGLGPIVALVNDRDDHHQECKSLLERLPDPLLIVLFGL